MISRKWNDAYILHKSINQGSGNFTKIITTQKQYQTFPEVHNLRTMVL